MLTDCGEIFTWGRGGFGRLGHGNREPADSPKRIEALEGIPCVQVRFDSRQYGAMRVDAVRCGVAQYGDVRCGVVQRGAERCSAV